MKLQKKLLSLVLTAGLVLTSTVTAFASPADDLQSALQNAGVPSSQLSKVVEYLQKVTITQAQADAAIAKVKDASTVANGATDLSKLSTTAKDQIKSDITAAATQLGLTADLSTKNSDGKTVVVIKDNSGTTLISVDSTTAKTAVTSFNPAALENVITAAKSFSNDPEKAKFVAVDGGVMKKTATNYGNLMGLGGLMVVAASGALFFVKKK
jgi:hypothetical protein